MITSNTLFKITKHTNKTLKIADFLCNIGQPILFNKLAYESKNSSDVDIINAFNDDLNTTLKTIEDVHMLLSTVNDDGIVLHLKGEQSLEKIFEDFYDKQNQIVKFAFGGIKLKKHFVKEDLKAMIVNKFLNTTLENYESMIKKRNKIFTLSETELVSDEDKIEFLGTVPQREEYSTALNSIKSVLDGYVTFRKKLPLEIKNKIDITFKRSMVDSISKSSSYITTNDGLVQMSSAHKKDTEDREMLKKIEEELKTNIFIEAVEIDQDTDLNAFYQLMTDIKKVNFNLSKSVVLKSRKLGNYRANGLYFENDHIVALDVNSPSACIHEFVHAVDLANPNLFFSQQRTKFASLMRNRLDLTGMSRKDTSYYSSTAEIIARAGEVAYVLNEFGFDEEKENILDFKERIKEEEAQKSMYDLNMAKKIEKYINSSNIYFDLENMNKQEFKAMKSFYKAYFGIGKKLEIKSLIDVPVPDHIPHKVVGTSERYQPGATALFSDKNIVKIFEYNKEHKIIDEDIIVKAMLYRPLDMGRTTKEISNASLNDKKLIIKVLCEYAEENDDFYLMSRIAEARIHADKNIDLDPLFLVDGLLTKKEIVDFNYRDKIDNYIEQSEDVRKRIVEREAQGYDYFATKALERENIKIVKETIDQEQKILLETKKESDLYEKHYEIKVDSMRFKDSKKSILNNTGSNNFFKHVDYMIQRSVDKSGSQLFNYFNEKDLFPLATITQDIMKANNLGEPMGLRAYKMNFNTLRMLEKKEGSYISCEQPYQKRPEMLVLLNKFGKLKDIVELKDKFRIVTNKRISDTVLEGSPVLSSEDLKSKLQDLDHIDNVDTIQDIYTTVLKGVMTNNDIPRNEIEKVLEITEDSPFNELNNYDNIQKQIREYKSQYIREKEEQAQDIKIIGFDNDSVITEKVEEPEKPKISKEDRLKMIAKAANKLK